MPVKSKNSFGIPYLRSGIAPVDRVLWGILDALDQLRIQSSATTSASTGPGGTLVRAAASSIIYSAPAHPFLVRPSAGDKVTVAYGTVTCGGVTAVPVIGGTSLFSDPPPELTCVSGTIFLEATVDAAGALTALEIKNAASTPTDTSTLKRRTIASVTVVSGQITALSSPQSVITSLTLFLCNGTAVWEQA